MARECAAHAPACTAPGAAALFAMTGSGSYFSISLIAAIPAAAQASS